MGDFISEGFSADLKIFQTPKLLVRNLVDLVCATLNRAGPIYDSNTASVRIGMQGKMERVPMISRWEPKTKRGSGRCVLCCGFDGSLTVRPTLDGQAERTRPPPHPPHVPPPGGGLEQVDTGSELDTSSNCPTRVKGKKGNMGGEVMELTQDYD